MVSPHWLALNEIPFLWTKFKNHSTFIAFEFDLFVNEDHK